MAIVKNISGVAWAADILTGRKPIPTYKAQEPSTDFQDILNAEVEERRKAVDMGRSDDQACRRCTKAVARRAE